MQTSSLNPSNPRPELSAGANTLTNSSSPLIVELESAQQLAFERAVIQKDKVTLSEDRSEKTNIELASDNDKSPPSDKVEEEVRVENGQMLSEAQQRDLAALKARDLEVKAHERAHKAAGGQHAGSISYEYRLGPNGKRYAVGGEVSIDVSPVSGDPQKTIEKMNVIIAAALAPADPSPQDRRVAAKASQVIASARAELNASANDSRQESAQDSNSSSDLRINKRGVESYNTVSDLNSEPSNSAQQFVDDIA